MLAQFSPQFKGLIPDPLKISWQSLEPFYRNIANKLTEKQHIAGRLTEAR